ncbi:IclR family transcriptional regulator [Nocardia carnea]|uniref:IclR family transcriptional regulator n=1 Tax=Nocardia carnea TaxID=37328 RepID=UPI00245713FA|nr:IclR family transcriptional regulator [Nocardia carnea]
MATARTGETPTAMIDRVASILESFVGHRPLTLAEVARGSGLPRSSAHRILQRLVELGWVERNEFKYALGHRMFELGTHFTRQRSVHRAALPVMTELHRRTGLTAHLSMLTGGEILHLERVGVWPGNAGEWSVGARQPVVRTAAGRALLAAIRRDEWPEIVFGPAPTCYTVHSAGQLDRDLARTRDRGGVAVDAQGCALGVTVVAAPIATGEGGHFALSLCGPTTSIRTEAVIADIRRAAAAVWRQASGIPPLRVRPREDRPSASFARTTRAVGAPWSPDTAPLVG